MKTLLFARHMRQAKEDYLRHLDPDDRRNVTVILRREDEFKIRGLNDVALCFLDRWWENWNPIDANMACTFWPFMLGADRIWEVKDNEAVLFMLRDEKRERDEWIDSPAARKFREMRSWDRICNYLRPSLDALPGLDDKTHNPVGGVVFSEIFDIDDPDSSYPLYADWFIRKHVRDANFYLKETLHDVA